MTRVIRLCFFTVFFLTAAAMAEDTLIEKDKQRFEGKWKITTHELAGKAQPVPEGLHFEFAGDKLMMVEKGAERALKDYKIDPHKTPREIDIIGGVGRLGIYTFGNDSLILTRQRSCSRIRCGCVLNVAMLEVTDDALR